MTRGSLSEEKDKGKVDDGVMGKCHQLVERFGKRFPSNSREAVIEAMALYGIRALLAEVAMDRVQIEDIAAAARSALPDVERSLAASVKKPSYLRKEIPKTKLRPRKDAANFWPFVDKVGCVGDVFEEDDREPNFESLAARDQIRRAKSVYARTKRGANSMPRELVASALDEVVGRTLNRATHDVLRPASVHVTLLQFLRMVNRFLVEGERPDISDNELWRRACASGHTHTSESSDFYPDNVDQQQQQQNAFAWNLSPPAPQSPTTQAKSHENRTASTTNPAGSTTSKQQPKPAKRRPKLSDIPSKIKPELDKRRAALRQRRQLAKQAEDSLLAGGAGVDAWTSDSAQPRRTKALDIADAFLRSPLVTQWNLTNHQRISVVDEEEDTQEDTQSSTLFEAAPARRRPSGQTSDDLTLGEESVDPTSSLHQMNISSTGLDDNTAILPEEKIAENDDDEEEDDEEEDDEYGTPPSSSSP